MTINRYAPTPRPQGVCPRGQNRPHGYGDVPIDVPVASRFGRFLVEYLCDHAFDVAHLTQVQQPYGGKVARRYPTPDGELNSVRARRPCTIRAYRRVAQLGGAWR